MTGGLVYRFEFAGLIRTPCLFALVQQALATNVCEARLQLRGRALPGYVHDLEQ